MNIFDKIKKEKAKREKEKRIFDAIKKGWFVQGEGDYIVYDLYPDTMNFAEILFTKGPVSELDKKEQLKRLMQLWARKVTSAINLERETSRIDGTKDMKAFDEHLMEGVPEELVNAVKEVATYRLK